MYEFWLVFCFCVITDNSSVSRVVCRFSQQFYRVERTLCNVPLLSLSRWGQEEGEVIIDVFTSSASGENYTIEVTPVEDAELK